MPEGDLIHIEVAYAELDEQLLLSLNVPEGTTVEQAIEQSGILAKLPQLNIDSSSVGIFGRVTKKTQKLNAGDRVEIYRPLIADPKVVRRERAAQKKAAAAQAAKKASKRNRGASGSDAIED